MQQSFCAHEVTPLVSWPGSSSESDVESESHAGAHQHALNVVVCLSKCVKFSYSVIANSRVPLLFLFKFSNSCCCVARFVEVLQEAPEEVQELGG